MTSTLVIDGAEMARLLRSPTGPLGRHLIERGTVFQAAARAQLAPHRKSGCLEDSIVKRIENLDGEIALRVISDTAPCSPDRTSYSLLVHEGTAPHDIVAQSAGSLGFYWANGPDGPGVYHFASVHHPGTAPVPFLTDNLALFGA